jgi:1-pyrroline-5-carboxylate dehydrogenase
MGNTVLWKPATTAVLSNYVTYQILQEAGLPDGVISFLPAAGKTIGEAINHKEFAGLHFTGSTAVFNTLWQQIGSNLGNYRGYPRIVGETGGKNFHLIHPSADVDHAVNSTIQGAFEYQGQKCSACSRLYVPRSVWEGKQFREKLLEGVKAIHVGQPDDMKTFMTAVIDGNAYKDHVAYIEHARSSSPTTEIIAGGTYSDKEGYFIQPTVILTKDPMYKSMKEEIFGPVLSVYVYDDAAPNYWNDLLKIIDTTSMYALTGAIFAQDRSVLMSTADKLRHSAGNLYLNDKSTGAVVGEQPFGGARASGTNDKAGSYLNLLRWVSARSIKEKTTPTTTWRYPHMN